MKLLEVIRIPETSDSTFEAMNNWGKLYYLSENEIALYYEFHDLNIIIKCNPSSYCIFINYSDAIIVI